VYFTLLYFTLLCTCTIPVWMLRELLIGTTLEPFSVVS